jgi:outer membrane protein assembly factor BamB
MRSVIVFLLASLGSQLVSMSASAAPRLIETASAFSSVEPEFGPGSGFALLPRRTSASFSGARGRVGISANAFGAQYESVVCGPSAAMHTMTCRSLPTAQFLTDIPIPGFVSATPFYFEDSWIVGTSKGFLARFRKQQGSDALLPPLRAGALNFWGAESRKTMGKIRSGENERVGFQWSFYAGSEVIGSPIVFEKTVFAVAANQFLYAIDVSTGQPRWTLRLAPDSTLRLESAALAPLYGRGEILVGTAEGVLMSISAKTGAVSWRRRLEAVQGERFRSIVAKPLVLENGIVVSSAEGVTEFLGFGKCTKEGVNCSSDERIVEWKYSLGSLSSPRLFDGGVALGGHEGSVVLLDPHSGALRWRVSVFPGASVASMAVVSVAGRKLLVASSFDGAVALLDNSGRALDVMPSFGEVAGEFFAGHEGNDICLSYATPGFRCFSVTN